MARFIGVAFGFVSMVLLQCVIGQRVHVVGDSLGWTIPIGNTAAYANWARGKTFVVGDILTFNFATNRHDVLRVQKSSFDSCSASNSIGNIITTGPVNITLDSAGDHYYICTISGHCQIGQKLAFNVSSSGGALPPTTTPATPTSPAPTSNTTIDCPTPVGGPTSSTTPETTVGSIIPPPPNSSASKVISGIWMCMLSFVVGSCLF